MLENSVLRDYDRCHGKMGTPKIGDPHPHFTGNMGMGIPIFPVKRGPGSPFYWEYGDHLTKIGTPWDPRFHGKMGMGVSILP